jgi:hypothetical protein
MKQALVLNPAGTRGASLLPLIELYFSTMKTVQTLSNRMISGLA